jgi:integrase
MTKKRSKADSKPAAGVYEYTKDGLSFYRVIFRYLVKDGSIKQSQRRGFSTVQEANEFRRSKDKELEQAQTPIDDQITLGEYLDYWQERYVMGRLKQSTIDGYTNNIRIIKEHLGNIRLYRLSYRDINTFYIKLQRPSGNSTTIPKALNSVKYIKRVLHKALEDAILEKIIRENPSKGIKLSGKSKTVYKTLTKAEVAIVREAIKETSLFLPVSFSVSLGLRRAEALGLRWEDINFESGIISIRQTIVMTSVGPILQTPKTKHSIRDIPMPTQIRDLLLAEKESQASNRLFLGGDYHENDFVCCKENGDAYSPNYITHRFSKVLEELSLTKIRYHDLRHTFATIALENNVPLKVVSALLGHSNIAVTANIYSHVTEPLARRHSDIIATAIFD